MRKLVSYKNDFIFTIHYIHMNTPWGYIKEPFRVPFENKLEYGPRITKHHLRALRTISYEKSVLLELYLKVKEARKMVEYMDKDVTLPWCKIDPYEEALQYESRIKKAFDKQKQVVNELQDIIDYPYGYGSKVIMPIKDIHPCPDITIKRIIF